MASIEYINPSPKKGHSPRSRVILLDSFRNPARIAEFAGRLGISYPLAAVLLTNKRLDGVPLDDLLAPFTVPPGVPEHPISSWPDTIRTVAAFLSLPRDTRFGIYGDYDADGVTSVIILRQALLSLGFPDPGIEFSSLDEEGFGLSAVGVERLLAAGCSQLLVLDTGTNSEETLAQALEGGLAVTVIDHHPLTDGRHRVPGVTYLNPHLQETARPEEMRNAGLSWYFARCLAESDGHGDDAGLWGYSLALAALGTVGDAGNSMEGPCSHWLLHNGLAVGPLGEVAALEGLFGVTAGQFMLDISEPSVTEGFRKASLGKRSRLFSPRTAFELLVPDATAETRSASLRTLSKHYEDFDALSRRGTAWLLEHDAGLPVMVAAVPADLVSPDYVGLSGTLASKVAYQTGRPAIIFVRDGAGGFKGSWRMARTGRDGEALVRSIDHDVPGLVARYGGHAPAGGVSISSRGQLLVFEQLVQQAWAALGGGMGGGRPRYDAKPVGEVSETFATAVWEPGKHGTDLAAALRFAPFSRYETRRPSFLLPELTVGGVSRGKAESVVSFTVDGSPFRCKLPAGRDLPLVGTVVDAVVTLTWDREEGIMPSLELVVPSECRMGSFTT